MAKPITYRIEIESEIDGQRKSESYEGNSPFLAFHAGERINSDNEWYVIDQVHHTLHETKDDILHSVVLSCRKDS